MAHYQALREIRFRYEKLLKICEKKFSVKKALLIICQTCLSFLSKGVVLFCTARDQERNSHLRRASTV